MTAGRSASRRAAARSRAGRPSVVGALLARARASSWSSRRPATADRRADPHARRHRRVREGGAAGGARRARRPRGALGQGPARRTTPAGLVLAAVPERADPRDALVGATLADLPTGALVATGSVRRRAQLAALRPDLAFARAARQHRDPAATRPTSLRRDRRRGRRARPARAAPTASPSVLDPAVLLPAGRAGRARGRVPRRRRRRPRDPRRDRRSRRARARCDAERAFLAELGGGCNLPCGALAGSASRPRAVATHLPELTIDVLLAALDGRIVLRAHVDRVRPGRQSGASRAPAPRRARRPRRSLDGASRDRLPRRRRPG